MKRLDQYGTWCQSFKNKDFNKKDELKCGHSSKVNIDFLEHLINRIKNTIEDLTVAMNVSWSAFQVPIH